MPRIAGTPFGTFPGMLDPPVDTCRERRGIAHGETRLVKQCEVACCRQIRHCDNRYQPAGHGFDDADGFDIRDGAVHEQIARTKQIGHVGVAMKADMRRTLQSAPCLNLQVMPQRTGSGDDEFDVVGMPATLNRLDQGDMVFFMGQPA